ncbi:fused MFS/spermidine synthase [Ideonella sp. YS5]|uniref:fused MFS/spermidine synthase n=1 Tax=Ideonella sp. YS5 TaxID=3453714 RepID=UPI003EEFBA22
MAEGHGNAALRRLALGLMAATGFAGLGYQIVWTQQFALWLGHEAAAVMAVVAAFFGGLALGSWLLAGRIERSPRPGWWYAGCEAVIGLWGLALSALMPALGGGLQSLTTLQAAGAQLWAVAFVGCLVLLLPATVAMGASLPAMQRVLSLQAGETPDGRCWAGLYAANTAGAVAGALGAALVLVPAWGLARSAMACAALNLGAALLAWQWYGRAFDLPAAVAREGNARGPLAMLFATGLLGIGYELLVVRVLSQVTEDTVYTFALLLAVYLAGSAAGAQAYRRWSPAAMDDSGQRTTRRLGGALALACLLGASSLWAAEALRDGVTSALLGVADPMSAAVTAEAVLAVAAFAPATVVMGALFSHLCRCAMAQGATSGRCLAVNTLGGALASPLIGVLLLPAVGAKAGLLLLACGYAALGWRSPRSPWAWAPLTGAALAAVLAPALVFIQQPEGGRLAAYREGVSSAVSVVEDAEGVSRLYINNRQQEGSSASWRVDGRQALLPLLLHPAPRHALFLGLGTGVTAATATLDPAVNVQAVELLPEVVELSSLFTAALADQGVELQRLRVHAADARRFVRLSPEHFDLIVADNFHPARSGSGSLYTVEHFQAVRARLADGGLFCQWLPLHQLDLPTLASIVASFQSVFPQARAVLASNSLSTPVLGLVGGTGTLSWQPGQLQRRLAQVPQAAAFGFEDPLALLGSFVAGPSSLRQWAAGAPLNTDDRPVVAYRAPRATYAPQGPPVDRLVAWLGQLDPQTDSLVDRDGDQAWSSRLAAYVKARRHFIAAGRGVPPLADPQAMLARIRDPLMNVLRESPDFRPAYDPLWRLATVVAARDPHAARAVLTELIRLQTARTEAASQLDALGVPP